jgi:ribosomal protein S18 acetylase RimI-like enzyme
MNSIRIETTECENEDVAKYLSDSIISYGIEQLNGNETKRVCCAIKDNNGNLIGGVMGHVTLNLFFISHLYVESEYRGRGHGSKLLEQIENKAKSYDCNLLRLNTLNKETKSLYERAGFEITISIPSYMNGFDLLYYHKKI